MSRLNKNDRLMLKAMRECTQYGSYYDEILEKLDRGVEERRKAQLDMPYRRSRGGKVTPDGEYYPYPSRDVLRHQEKKKRCDFNRKTRGAARTREIGIL